MIHWKLAWNGWLNVFLKASCPLCNRPATGDLCASCLASLRRCRLANPQQFWQTDLPLFVWGNYGGMLKRAIAALKYENQPQLAKVLGSELGKAWQDSLLSRKQQLRVIPIPLHGTKLKQRGYNQAQLLAERFCEVTGMPLWASGLKRVRQTDAQFGLSATERSVNLAGAFEVGKVKGSGGVLLLDDIYTTGATARSAAQVLQQRGISVVGILAIATSRQK